MDFQIVKSMVILVGKQIMFYDYKSSEQKQVQLVNSAIAEAAPTTSFFDREMQLLLIGFDNG